MNTHRAAPGVVSAADTGLTLDIEMCRVQAHARPSYIHGGQATVCTNPATDPPAPHFFNPGKHSKDEPILKFIARCGTTRDQPTLTLNNPSETSCTRHASSNFTLKLRLDTWSLRRWLSRNRVLKKRHGSWNKEHAHREVLKTSPRPWRRSCAEKRESRQHPRHDDLEGARDPTETKCLLLMKRQANIVPLRTKNGVYGVGAGRGHQKSRF